MTGCMMVLAAVCMTGSAPTIDGNLDEPMWQTATWETGFQRMRGSKTGRQPPAQTSFAIAADAENLYLGVKADHPDMAAVNKLGKTNFWTSEAVEFYFAPDGGAFDFYQFAMSYPGEKAAIFYSEGGNIRPDPYGPVWEVKTREVPGGWCAEARIPLSAFYMTRTPAWKGTWRVNVARAYRIRAGVDPVYSCWADAYGFRDAKNYKVIAGFPIRRAEEDVFVRSVVAEVSGPAADGKLAGRLKLDVRTAKSGTFALVTPFTDKQEVKLRFGDNALTLPAVLPENGRHQMSVELTRLGDGCVLARTYPLLVDYEPIRLKLTVPQYRGNFYPGQNSDRVAGRVTCAVKGPAKLVLEGPGFGRRETTAAEDGTFAFDTKGFADGTATLTVTAGTDTYVKKIRKLAPLTDGRRVSWIENGHLVIDGKPVLRRNMYADGYRGGLAFRKRYEADDLCQTPEVKSLGTLEPGRLVKGIEQREATKDVRPSPELFAAADKAIANAKETRKDGVVYYISDEPECRNLSPVYLKHYYDYVCEKDPYHVILSCSRGGETYVDCADWFETHPYLNPHYDENGVRLYGRDPNVIGSYVDAFRPEAHPDKCIGGTPTCFAYSEGEYPTFFEYVLNFWCEFVRGAKSMYPYAYHDLGDRPTLYEGTRYAFTSARALQDVLLFGERRTLAQTKDYEVCLWTMPDGERMFVALNFTQTPQRAAVKGLEGLFREFRGDRVFGTTDNRQTTDGFVVDLAPLETVVACEKSHDEGLPTRDETIVKIDALERERLGRDNQLLGRYLDLEITTSTPATGARKMFDGTRDVYAWDQAWGTNKFYEISFPKFVPRFSAIGVYGANVAGTRVKIREGGEWKELAPVSKEEGEFFVRYAFDRDYSTVKLRLEFPKNHVELYEIELPGKARELPKAKAEGVTRRTNDFWSVTVPEEFPVKLTRSVKREPGQRYLTFDFREPSKIEDGKYTNWSLYLWSTAGHLAGQVTTPLAGLYTLRLPDYEGEPKTDNLVVYAYNLHLRMGDVVCSREPPENRAEFVEKNGKWAVRVTLDEPCADVTCKLMIERGQGPRAFSADGKSTLELRPVDGTGKVWAAVIPIPQSGLVRNADGRLPKPFVRVTVLGGAEPRPIYTWLCRNS